MTKVKQIWLGKVPKFSMGNPKIKYFLSRDVDDSYRLLTPKRTIMKFNNPFNDRIIHFWTPKYKTGRIEPILVGSKNIYFLSDGVYVPRKLFPKKIDFDHLDLDLHLWLRNNIVFQNTARKIPGLTMF